MDAAQQAITASNFSKIEFIAVYGNDYFKDNFTISNDVTVSYLRWILFLFAAVREFMLIKTAFMMAIRGSVVAIQ